jgi:LmbE family N-acetylglucosaminyl deacetylase
MNRPTHAVADAPFGVIGTPLHQWQASEALARVPEIPIEALIPQGSRLVVAAPHPDDEVLACGGLLAAMAERIGDLHLISLTDGDASHPGSQLWPVPRLRAQRLLESECALARLGLDVARLSWQRLALPDSRVAEHEAQLTAALAQQLRPGDFLLTTWRHDGHGDHEAAGRAAAQAARAQGASLLEMPVWAWHWAHPEDPRLPWGRARKLQLSEDQLMRKRHAIRAHVSQLHDDPTTGASPVLDRTTLERLLQPFELVFT